MGTAPRLAPNQVARSMLITVLGNVFPPLAALITAPVLAHVLGVHARGEVAAATAPYLLVTTAVTFGIPDSMTFAIARRPWIAGRVLRNGTVILGVTGIASAVALAMLAPWLSKGNANTSLLITLCSIAIVPALCLGAIRGAAAGLHLWNLVAWERITSSCVRVAAVVGLALGNRLTTVTACAVVAFVPLVGLFAYRGLPRRMARTRVELEAGHAPRLVRYGLSVWFGGIAGILLSRLDQAVMVPLSTVYELGLYAVAVTVSEIPLIVNNAVRDVIFAADSADPADERLAKSARISSSACAVLGLLVAVTLPIGLPLLFGTDFAPALGASLVLLAAVVLGTPGSIAGSGLSGRGRPGLRSVCLVVACISNVALMILLVPQFGALGAAFATLIGNLIASTLAILMLWRYFSVPPLSLYGWRRRDVAAIVDIVERLRRLYGEKHRTRSVSQYAPAEDNND
jgi:O-antigen/teichoic acid export membrane protein